MADGKLCLNGKLSLDEVMKELQVIKSTQKRYAEQFLNDFASGAACSCFSGQSQQFKSLRTPLLGSIPLLNGWQNHFEKPKIPWMIWSNMDVGTA